MNEEIISLLEGTCLTTDVIARKLDVPVPEALAACIALARDDKIYLASYGWNARFAWADINWAGYLDHPDHEQEPWHMTPIERAGVLAS